MPGELTDQPFLRLDEVILPPPWPAVMTITMVLGLFSLGLLLAQRLRGRPTALEIAAGFISATAGVAALVQGLAMAGLAGATVLRLVGTAVVVASLALLSPHSRHSLRRLWASAVALAGEASPLERWLLAASSLTIGGLGLASLGPPTDIDTLAYHLSVPLDWLARGGAQPAPEWISARLVGVGESLNLLGLAMGSDCFGAALQVAGLAAAAAAVACLAGGASGRVLASAVVIGCPAAIFLSLSAKPQLLPAAASTVALALFVTYRRAPGYASTGALWVLFSCVSFAAASKYTFIPGAAAITVLVVWSARKTQWRGTAMTAAVVTFAVIALPVYVRNLAFYGDPVSPLLEPLRPDQDPAVMAFRWYLRNFAGDHSLGRLLRLPWDLVVASGPGRITTVLGLGVLAGLTVPFRRWQEWDVFAAATLVLAASLVGQLQARFFFEPYLWFALIAAMAPWTRRKRLLVTILAAQMLATVPVALYGTAWLLPAALSSDARERTLTAMASDYGLSRWLDEVLPADAVVATDRHSSLFAPRRATHADYVRMLRFSPDQNDSRRRIASLVARSGATWLLVTEPVETSPFAHLIAGLGPPAAMSPTLRDAVRNPWREGPSYRVLLYRLSGDDQSPSTPRQVP